MPNKSKPKKTVKNKKATKSSEKDKMMVLLEDMRDEIKTVAEGHSILQRGINGLVEQVNDLVIGQSGLETRMTNLENKMDEGFKLVFDHLYGIENELMEIKSEIKDLRQELKSKADLDRLAALEERVRKIEMRQVVLRDEGKKKYKG